MFDFEEEGAFSPENSLRDLDVVVRIANFLLTNELTLGTLSGSAKLVSSVSKKGYSSTLHSLVPCVSVKMRKKRRGLCGTNFVAIHLRPNCLVLASISKELGDD